MQGRRTNRVTNRHTRDTCDTRDHEPDSDPWADDGLAEEESTDDGPTDDQHHPTTQTDRRGDRGMPGMGVPTFKSRSWSITHVWAVAASVHHRIGWHPAPAMLPGDDGDAICPAPGFKRSRWPAARRPPILQARCPPGESRTHAWPHGPPACGACPSAWRPPNCTCRLRSTTR